MFMFIVFFICLLMTFYVNVLFYTFSLVFISVLVLFDLVSSGFMSTLTYILIMVVYLGAVMILVGYICAICPNVNTSSSFSLFGFFSMLIFLYFFFYSSLMGGFSFKSDWMMDFFFSKWGSYMFLFIAVFLFLTLLMVTSQFFSPQGPLRSSN